MRSKSPSNLKVNPVSKTKGALKSNTTSKQTGGKTSSAKIQPSKSKVILPKFAPPPRICDGKCSWSGITVKNDSMKGWGLYASRSLKASYALPYGGETINNSEAQNLLSHSRRMKANGEYNSNADYLMYAEEESKNLYLDGHPRKFSKLFPEGPKDAWIGTFCNEPAKGERANCELIFAPPHSVIPDYPCINKSNIVFIHLTCDLDKGEELLIRYGWDAKRYRNLNYTPGYDVYEYPPVGVVKSTAKSSSEIYAPMRSDAQVEHSMKNIENGMIKVKKAK